ncbi:hypothetical protein FB45DRAFT_690746, partial [Roridomyces roridus]
MAELARGYYDDLQSDESEQDLESKDIAIEEALQHIPSRENLPQMQPLKETLQEEAVLEALKQSSNGTAPGMDGIPNELWKRLHCIFLDTSKKNNDLGPSERKPAFDVVRTLTAVFNDVETNGTCADSKFA